MAKPLPSGPHDHKVQDVEGLVAALAGKADTSAVYTKAEIDALLVHTHGPPEPDPDPDPEPDPEPSGVLWSHDFEDGTIDGLRFSSDSDTTQDVIPDPTGRSQFVLELTGDTADGNRSGNRARCPSNITGLADPDNLPADATYSAWFYLKDDQTSNNLFQWKQAWLKNMADPAGAQSKNITFKVRVNHEGGGDHSLHMVGKIDQTGAPVIGSSFTVNSTGGVQTGRWYHLEARYLWDSDGNGIIQAWLDGTLWCDWTGYTQYPLTQGPSDPLPGAPTYKANVRQWTVNNYMISGSGPWVPPVTSILWDDLAVTV